MIYVYPKISLFFLLFEKSQQFFLLHEHSRVDDNFFTSRSIMSFEHENNRFLKIVYYGF